MHRELVDRAKQGDEEAFDALARQVGDRCMAIAYRILRDADLAEDAVQAALVVAWRGAADAARSRSLRALAPPDPDQRVLRRGQASHAVVGRHPAPAGRRTGARPAGILTVNDRDQLERAFRRLTLEQRAVLVFHHYLGLPLPEVAERLGIPLGTAKSRLHHATAALRASLDADARTSTSSQERLA